jgi:hypothetical protein
LSALWCQSQFRDLLEHVSTSKEFVVLKHASHPTTHTHNSTFLACSVNDTAPSAPGGHPTRGDATLWHATFGHAAVAHARFGHTTTGHAAVGHAAVGHAAVGHPTRLLGAGEMGLSQTPL